MYINIYVYFVPDYYYYRIRMQYYFIYTRRTRTSFLHLVFHSNTILFPRFEVLNKYGVRRTVSIQYTVRT